jgi:hypothetical protein
MHGLIPSNASAVQPAPIAIYSFVDKLQVWLQQPLRKSDPARLRKHCGSLRTWNERAGFNPLFRQRLQLCQPTPETLQMIAECGDVHMNYIEVALDWIFDNDFECDDALAFLDRYHVKKYHRDQGIRWHKRTRYTGPRRAPTVLAAYADKECKLTGETACCHLDWRIRGSAALKRAAIATATDLLNLDYREFWRERLLLFALDLRDLGRRHFNYINGTKRRRSWISVYYRLRYDHDKATGAIVFNVFDRSTQKVLDYFGSKFHVRDCLIPLDVEHLLPSTCERPYYDLSNNLPSTPKSLLPSRRSLLGTHLNKPHRGFCLTRASFSK